MFGGRDRKQTNDDDLAFVLPRNYCITMENSQFLPVDSAHEGRMLIFGSDDSIRFLASSPNWYIDGTFDTVPPQFLQLYTIHGLQNGRYVTGL